MARLEIGVAVSGQIQVDKLATSLGNADKALDSWIKTSKSLGSNTDRTVRAVSLLDAEFKKLAIQAQASAASLTALFQGPKASATAAIYGQVAAVQSLKGEYDKLVNTFAKQELASNAGVVRLRQQKEAIEANIAAYNKLKASGGVSGIYDKNVDYSYQLSEVKKLDEINKKIAASEANIAAMRKKNEAELLAGLRAEEKARQEVVLATIKQFEAERALEAKNLQAATKAEAAAKKRADWYMLGRGKLEVGDQVAAEKAVSQTAKSVNQLGDAWDKAGKKSRTFHDALRGASGALGSLWMTYGQILPLLAGFAAAGGTLKTVTAGSEFDYTARSIEILAFGYETLKNNADLANKSLEDTKKRILAIEDSPFSAGQLGEGILEFVRAGYKEFEANLKGIEAASRFAYIGQMDLGKAVELVVGQMSAFKGLSAAQAFNTMAVVADKTSVNLQQMTEAFKNVTSLGTVMGLTFEDTAVALGVLGQAGIRGATAGAALNTMMYKLIAPTATAKKKMDELNISFKAFDNKGNIKSIREIAFELAEMTKDLSANKTAEVFESMVGLRGVKALGALVQMAKTSTKEFDALSESVKNSGSYLEGYFDLLKDSGKTQIELLKASFDNLFTANYDNASVVKAVKDLREVIKDPTTAEALSVITSSIIELSTLLIQLGGTFGTTLAAGYLGKVIFGSIAGWAAAAAAAKAAAVESLVAAGAVGAEQAAAMTSTTAAIAAGASALSLWGPIAIATYVALDKVADKAIEARKNVEGLSDVDLANTMIGGDLGPGFIDFSEGIKEVGEAAKTAKEKLVDLNGVKVEPEVFNEESVTRLEKVGNFFDDIRDKILDANKTPLEVVNAKTERDVINYFNVLASGGMTLKEMIALTDSYVTQLDSAGDSGEIAAKKIEKIQEAAIKAGGTEADIKKLTDNLRSIAAAANAKDIAEANKKMIAGMRKEWQDYADKVISIQDNIAENQRTLSQELRAIDQSNMTGMSLWRDRKKEADEYRQAAIEAGKAALKALEDGDKVTAESKYKQAEESFKQSVQITKSLNVEVVKSTKTLDEQIKRQEAIIAQHEAWKARLYASGQSTKVAEAAIKYQRGILDQLQAQQKVAETTVLQTKEKSSEVVKEDLQKIFSDFTAFQKQYQEGLKAAMDSVEKQAASKLAPGTALDMTEGMEESKARFIQNWMEAKEAVKAAITEIPNEITAQMVKITVPSENWNNSIFAMKGVFVQAVDEMAIKLNSEFSTEKNVVRFSNVFPPAVKDNLTEFSTQIAAVGASADAVGESLKKVFEPPADGDWGKVWIAMNEASAKSANNVTKDWRGVWDNWLEGGSDNIDKLQSQLNDLIKDRSMTVTVKMVETKQSGGLIGGYMYGGAIQGLANGGSVMRNMLSGGFLPGFGGGDRRLILGEDGEVMLNKFAVRSGGLNTALAYNAGDFQTVIENLSERTGGSKDSVETVVWKFTDTGETAKIQGSPTDLRIIQRGLKRMERFKS